MIIKHWAPHRSEKLRGFARIEFDIGLIVPGWKVIIGQNGAFVAPPDRPSLQDGGLRRGADGKPVYEPIAEWRNRKTADKFSAAVIQLLLDKYPDALRDDEAVTTGRAQTGSARTAPSGSRLAQDLQHRLRR